MDTIRGASKEHGIEVGEVRFDFAKVIARSRAAADKLSKGVLYLLKKNKVDYFEADAVVSGPHSVALRQVEGKAAPSVATLEGERILIAAGSGEKLFPGMKVGDGVVTSHEALVLDKMPASVVVIGAGAIGLEFGYFYSAFGAKVTIVELEKQMLPGMDAEVAEELRRAFLKRGITVMLGHGYKSMARKGDGWSVTVTADGAEKVDRRRSGAGRGWTDAAQHERRAGETRNRARARRFYQGERFVPDQRAEYLLDRRRDSAAAAGA